MPTQAQETDSNPKFTFRRTKRIHSYSLCERSRKMKKENDFGLYFISYEGLVDLAQSNTDAVLNKIPIVMRRIIIKTFSAMAFRYETFCKEVMNDEIESISYNT